MEYKNTLKKIDIILTFLAMGIFCVLATFFLLIKSTWLLILPLVFLIFLILLILFRYFLKLIITRRLEPDQIDEIKLLLKQHKNLSAIKEKIQNWKNQGYHVEELEKMIEDIK